MSAPTTRELYDRYVIPTYGRFDVKLARGQGSVVWDEAGKRYLDFGAGIAVTSIGHCHPRVLAAMHAQLGTPLVRGHTGLSGLLVRLPK